MKIALVKKEATSFWKSCQSITNNLEKTYHHLAETTEVSIEVFGLEDEAGYHQLCDLAQKIKEGGFSHVAWIDHYPHPLAFLKAYFEIYPTKDEAPEFIFHLFGDFVLQVPLWEEAVEILDGVSVSMISASHRQDDLVASLLSKDNKANHDVMAFPVDENIFTFSEEKRSEMRKKWDVPEDSLVFLYTGRLSYQKNIFDLIRSFATYRKNFENKAYLFLCGPMDDLGIPYLGKEALPGTFFFHWEECFRETELKSLLNDGYVRYLGNVSTEELHANYCAADFYSSLSCHNDEDYGMSPAEATVCGLPCLLSSWGGFASFHKYFPNEVDLVPLSLNESRQAPQQVTIVKKMAVKSQSKLSNEERAKFGLRATHELGIVGSSEKLKAILEKGSGKSLQFNDKFYKLSAALTINKRAPFKGPNGGYSLFYRDIYKAYTGEGDE